MEDLSKTRLILSFMGPFHESVAKPLVLAAFGAGPLSVDRTILQRKF